MKTKTKRKYNRKKKSPLDMGTARHKQAAAYAFLQPKFNDEEVADALRAHAERKEWGEQKYKEGFEAAQNAIAAARSQAAITLMNSVGQTIQAVASAFGEMPR